MYKLALRKNYFHTSSKTPYSLPPSTGEFLATKRLFQGKLNPSLGDKRLQAISLRNNILSIIIAQSFLFGYNHSCKHLKL